MDWGGQGLIIIAIGAICVAGWVLNNWIRASHGYPLEDQNGGHSVPSDDAVARQLREENGRLQLRLEASEKRLAVLERIVTDRGFEVSAQIDALRDDTAGRPLDERTMQATAHMEIRAS